MNIGLILPDNPGWKSNARAANFLHALKEMGHECKFYFVKKDQCPKNLTGHDIVCNHAMQAPPEIIRAVAKHHSHIKFVHVNHSSIGHLELSGERLINRLCETIHSARDMPNIWIASVDASALSLASGLKRSIQMPIPLRDIEPRKNRSIKARPVIAMAGRVDAVKNQINQIMAVCLLNEKVDLHLCLDPPPWMVNVLKACGIKAKCHGLLDHSKWLAFLKTEADLLLQCSYTESFNISACEAMQSGVPVISTPAVKIADQELASPPDSPVKIADKIKTAIESYGVYSQRAAHLGQVAAQETRQLYKNAIDRVAENPHF